MAVRHRLGQAEAQIRDPSDIDLLALALAFSIPVWSQDQDFKTAGVPHFTTNDLLTMLA